MGENDDAERRGAFQGRVETELGHLKAEVAELRDHLWWIIGGLFAALGLGVVQLLQLGGKFIK